MTTTGSREMNAAVVLLLLGATGALAFPWPPEDRHYSVVNRPSGSPSYGRPPGDFGFSTGGESPPFGNDVGGGDDDDVRDYPPSRGSANARNPTTRPAARRSPNSNSDSILFPGATAGPGRLEATRPTVSPGNRRNTPTPATSRPGGTGTQRPGGTRQTSPGATRGTGTSNSRRSQDCQRFRRLKRDFAESSTISWKIVLGSDAREGEFPFMAALGFTGSNGLQFLCGGSLISERYILTAAHCITDARKQNLQLSVARLGQHTLTQGSSGPGDYAVEEATRHPEHDGNLRYKDVALLRLDRPVRLSAAVVPVCLPDAGAAPPPAGTSLLVAGWGASDRSGFGMSPILQKALLQVVQRDACEKLIGSDSALPRGISADMLCAQDPAGRSDTCSGDSGGPIVLRSTTGEDTLLGVTSFGELPCGGLRPGVYSLTSSVISWIESIVWR